jgi:uncharacterized protein YbcI
MRDKVNESQEVTLDETEESSIPSFGMFESELKKSLKVKVIKEKLEKLTGKKVVLEYHEDKSLIGGLVAQVGSFSFDDSLETQLRLMREDLKRKAN